MQWTESTVVDRPMAEVHDAIADENAVMRWSAWPAATGYTCAVDGDGRSIGSEIVFRNADGKEQGRQRLASVAPGLVEYRLRNRGPGGRDITPEVDFRLEDVDGSRTRVLLDFRGRAPLPPGLRQVAEFFLARRVRHLHRKDLEQLKDYVEQADLRS